MARDPDEVVGEERISKSYLEDFVLYETRSNFYVVGRDKNRTLWRVLKIARLETSELDIHEDTTIYSESECGELLKRIDEGNRSTGGLKFVTNCYGIVGFVKFLGHYYMLLITKRRAVGVICGHTIYAVTKSRMIALPNSNIWSNIANLNENRYKKLLSSVDLTKDFFFSYSYHIMQSLQNNISESQTGEVLYETIFVWNEFLTRGIRNHLKSTLWTVPLVHGFFKQAKLSISGKDFWLTLIARRSRHYAGTRYLKRGVNEKGRVANDVETEQIVFEDIPGGFPTRICSVVQNRGSIPLFWSQETSKLNIKPDIVLRKKDNEYEATRLHFENLVDRYGNPIIILNLIKSEEKKPRESILRSEFANAIETINKDLPDQDQLKFLHWDLHKHSRSKAKSVLTLLEKVADNVLGLTGFLFCNVTSALPFEGTLVWLPDLVDDATDSSCSNHYDSSSNHANNIGDSDMSGDGSQEEDAVGSESSGLETTGVQVTSGIICSAKPIRFQKGVLRTNCIDCLDRTNVAQYAYGLASLGHQLHALELINEPKIDIDAPLADDLMSFYERMGDTLALQYGGSAAHNKIFSERRGQWKAAIQSQELFRTLQRYYSNAYMDTEKQAAMNLFLGHFQPEKDKPALWELDFEQQYNIGLDDTALSDGNGRLLMKRSKSDGSILHNSNIPHSLCDFCLSKLKKSDLSGGLPESEHQTLSESTPEISLCGRDVSYSRHTPTISCRHFAESGRSYTLASGDSNFLDLDWISSCDYSCDEELPQRSKFLNSPIENVSTDNIIAAISTPPRENRSSVKGKRATGESSPCEAAESTDTLMDFSISFVNWVMNGETLCH